jgi:glycerol-3-phosphate acyltransferase PlsX
VARIALDASGGDFAPAQPVAGALEAVQNLPANCEIVLVGSRSEIEAELAKHGRQPDRISIVDAPEKIGMDEKPLAAVRSKRKSSIVTGLQLHRQGEVDAFISAGNTGAVMAASTLLLGLHDGVERPAIGTVLPSMKEEILLLDAGANVDCSPRELMGFAQLGAVYVRDVFERPDPVVGLLNIGEESEKGNAAAKEAYALLKTTTHFTFAGNIEGSDILVGRCDVVVCDGFVGNIVLKLIESVARTFDGMFRTALDASIVDSEAMKEVFHFLDYSSYGGAPLLGVQGVTIICHGRSSSRAIASALRVALRAVNVHLSDHIHDEFVEDGAVA